MKWQWLSLVAVVLLGGFLYIASSPWLVWHTMMPQTEVSLAFSDGLPAGAEGLPSLMTNQTPQEFMSLRERWRYVVAHRSARAWWETIITLATRSVPLHPAALFYTAKWFEEPTLVMVTTDGTGVRIRADPVAEAYQTKSRLALPALPAADSLQVLLPGEALAALPEPLQEAWNSRLHANLGFTATKPAIIQELSRYDWIRIDIQGSLGAIGIIGANEAAGKQWEARSTAWVVDEDRFRRPLTQAFRLPDGTLGREVVAGLPSMVWPSPARGEAIGQARCLTPLPDKPLFWLCEQALTPPMVGSTHVLANYHWHPEGLPAAKKSDWQITIGKHFLTALPAVTALRAAGTNTTAAGILTTQGN